MSTKRVQRSTMSKKIWLSMHPRNFGSDKIVVEQTQSLPAFTIASISRLVISPCHNETFSLSSSLTAKDGLSGFFPKLR